jgi:sulfite exporter TauE/SafE
VGLLSAGLPIQIRTRPVRQIPFTLAYNAGRVVSYMAAGAALGGMGAVLQDIAPLRTGQFVLKGLAGLMMLGVGLHLAGLWPTFARLERLGAPLWTRVRPLVARLLPIRSHARAAMVGLLWGSMPCGLVYAALGVALGTGSAIHGALTMLAFGIGTLPALMAMGMATSGIASLTRRPGIRRVAGVLVGTLGVLSLLVAVPQLGATWHPTLTRSDRSQVRHHCH